MTIRIIPRKKIGLSFWAFPRKKTCFKALAEQTGIPYQTLINLYLADCAENKFVDELRRHFPDPCRAVDICSDPDGWERTDFYAAVTQRLFEHAGFRFDRFRTLDGRNAREARTLIRESNLIILGGGHVPTQNGFFRRIGLRGLLRGYPGVVVGISAGSMNSADVVYAQPEEDGETVLL